MEKMADRALVRFCCGPLLILVLALVSVGGGQDCTKTQVFIDTDIGTDFDDSVAIAYALKSPTLEVRFILTATGDVLARTKVAAKYLQLAGLDHVPLGVGLPNQNSSGVIPLFTWAQDYDLKDYKGGVFLNGTDEMGRRILESPCKDVVILEIAPAANMPYLLSKYSSIAKKARVKAMAGSVYRGYDNSSTPTTEYNVKMCPKCMRELFQSAHPDPQALLNIQLLKIWVTDDGYTVVDDVKGTPMDVALTWKDNGLHQLEALFTAAVTAPTIYEIRRDCTAK